MLKKSFSLVHCFLATELLLEGFRGFEDVGDLLARETWEKHMGDPLGPWEKYLFISGQAIGNPLVQDYFRTCVSWVGLWYSEIYQFFQNIE